MAEGSIGRTLRILDALCMHGDQTLSEIAERVELTPPTVLRFLRLMRDEGFAVQDDQRRWSATLKVWQLGCAVVDRRGRGQTLNDALEQACAEIGETVVYSVYDNGRTVYIASAEPRRGLRTHVALGRTHPATDTITGRCLLAYQDPDEVERVAKLRWESKWRGRRRDGFLAELASIRDTGSAVGEGDIWQDLWGAAVPVRDRFGAVVGSMGTAMLSSHRPDDVDAIVGALASAARAASPL